MKTAKLTMFILLIAALLCGFTGGKAQSGFSLVKRPLDYSDAGNWIVYNDGEDTDADFFFIAPTVSASEGYNMPADKSLNKGSRLLNGTGEIKREETELCGAYIDPERGDIESH